MEIIKGGSQAVSGTNWKATGWAEVADISGVGTAPITSGNMVITIPNAPIIDWVVEIQRNLSKNAGDGSTISYARFFGWQNDSVTNLGDPIPHFIVGDAIHNSTTPANKPIFAKSNILQSYRGTGDARLYVHVYGKGQDANTDWVVSGIKARLIYLPFED